MSSYHWLVVIKSGNIWVKHSNSLIVSQSLVFNIHFLLKRLRLIPNNFLSLQLSIVHSHQSYIAVPTASQPSSLPNYPSFPSIIYLFNAHYLNSHLSSLLTAKFAENQVSKATVVEGVLICFYFFSCERESFVETIFNDHTIQWKR